jgi:hypothetical protein
MGLLLLMTAFFSGEHACCITPWTQQVRKVFKTEPTSRQVLAAWLSTQKDMGEIKDYKYKTLYHQGHSWVIEFSHKDARLFEDYQVLHVTPFYSNGS